MRREEWPSNLLRLVRKIPTISVLISFVEIYADMLTPIDQPLDKIDDLSKSEMYVLNIIPDIVN